MSYLSGRTQYVRCGMSLSDITAVLCGILSGISPWTDTFPAVHGEPTAADRASQSASTLVR